MSIRPPVFDNPINLERIPSIKPPFEFPAVVYYPDREHRRVMLITLVLVIVVFLFALLFGRPVLERNEALQAKVRSLVAISLLAMTAIQLGRPMLLMRGVPELLAVLGIVTCTLALTNEAITRQFIPAVMGILLTWTACEIALHFAATNRRSEGPLTLDAGFVLLLAIGVCLMWALKELILPQRSIAAVAMVSAACWVLIGLYWLQGGVCSLRDKFVYGLARYLYYPDSSELSPGVIASPAGFKLLRPIPFAIYVFSFSVEWLQSTENLWQLPGALIVSMWLGLSFVALGLTVSDTTIESATKSKWQSAVEANSESVEKLHRDAIYLGTVAADGSPVQVDRSLLLQHAHILGTTGSGKSSLGLAPLIEQLVRKGDSSVIVLDLKADSLELYASLQAASQVAKQQLGVDIPLRNFTIENNARSFAFNPFLTKGWLNMSMLERTDIVCAALGLDYGSDYGRAFFTNCNSAVILAANLADPNSLSFRQLFGDIDRLLNSQDMDGLRPEIKRAGVHAWSVVSRMATLDVLNVVGPTLDAPDVLEHQIDLTDFFQTPNLAYFQLPSTTAAIQAPAIARLVAYFLLVAGKQVKRKCKVFFVIDEFQRMAAGSLSQLFQLARGLDIGLILANQCMSDLHATDAGLVSAIESNCHLRQWFTVDNLAELTNMEKLFGTREEIKYQNTENSQGSSVSWRVEDVPRATITDLQMISDDPHLSILRLTGDRKGYGQYRGIPFVVRSEFHIDAQEYERRKRLTWPDSLPGMMIAGSTFVSGSSKSVPKPNPKPKQNQVDEIDQFDWKDELFE